MYFISSNLCFRLLYFLIPCRQIENDMRIVSKISIFGLLLTVLSCSVNKQNSKSDSFKSDEVAFIEYYQTYVGEVINGTAPKGRRIDSPTYRFDLTTKELEALRKPDFSVDTLSVIIGNGKILKGSAGNGMSSRLTGLNKLPYTLNKVTFVEVSSKGLLVNIDKKETLIKEGEPFEKTETRVDTIKSESNLVVKLTITSTINYHGLIKKSGIKFKNTQAN